jgi:RND family efflux transporter MFP subunit
MKSKLLALLFLPFVVACSKETPIVVPAERPALTLQVGGIAGEIAASYSGEIRARHEIPLGFRVGGKVAARLVDVGAVVHSGQVLARLDVGDATLQMGAAEAQLTLARAEVERYRLLFAKKFISQSALDAKETALQAATAQAGLARNQSGYTNLVAEHAGVVVATLAEVGQVVTTAQAVVKLAQDGEREVAIAVPEAQFSALKVGDTADVILFSGSAERHLAGRLRELSPAADPASRTYPARITLTDSAPDAALGMTAQVRFASRTSKSAQLIIPLTAIFQQDKNMAVWIVAKDHSVSLRPITVAAYRENGAVIASGLAAGERIVSNGVHRLSAGEKIQAIDTGTAQ